MMEYDTEQWVVSITGLVLLFGGLIVYAAYHSRCCGAINIIQASECLGKVIYE